MSSLAYTKPKLADGTTGAPAQATTIKPPSASPRVGATPFNTPADAPPLAVGRTKPVGRPINATSALRGRAHAATPGNTPSSLENISRRIANNLTMNAPQQGGPGNKIAPSYERRFSAGLADVDKRLATPHDPLTYASSSPSSSAQRAFIGTDWPVSFSEADSKEGDKPGKQGGGNR